MLGLLLHVVTLIYSITFSGRGSKELATALLFGWVQVYILVAANHSCSLFPSLAQDI